MDSRKKVLFSIIVLTFTFNSIAQTIFVSPVGNDTNAGTQTNPVKTFQVAADLAKSQGANVVQFSGGEYTFTSTAVLDPSHNGIKFQASHGEVVVFNSLQKINGWSVYNGSIMKASLPFGISHVRFLYDNSENWMERSATDSFSTNQLAKGDDGGCVECNNYTQSTQGDMSNIKYPSSFNIPDSTHAAQYDLRATTLPWHQEILPISTIDINKRKIFTAIPALYDLRKDVEEAKPYAWIINSVEGIDKAGEWASINGEIYLWPKSGTDDIYVPMLTELIRIDDGTVDGNVTISTPVSNITFDGITFRGGDFRTMESDDVTAAHDWMVIDEPDALLRIRNASNITIKNCVFEKSGGTGLRLDRYTQNIKIENNKFQYLGRGGINLTGRGPGYGDVCKNNEISYNILENIGMEKWASIAILLNNSSSNFVHHNYIGNTYFTGIAVVGPRQLMLAAWSEGANNFYVGREFQFREVKPSVISFMASNGGALLGSQEAMRFMYNYNNRIEENVLVDVCTGQDLFINGQIYVTGAQRSVSVNDIKTNYIERNYLYDSFEHSINDYALYSDSDQDDCNYIGNMINGINNADTMPEQAPLILAFNQWAESENEGMGQITLRANLTENSTFCNNSECGHTKGIDYVEEGEIINGVGGLASFVDIYKSMYATICDQNFPQIDSIPGAQVVRNRLADKIQLLGGSIPNCDSIIGIREGRISNPNIKIFPNPTNESFKVEGLQIPFELQILLSNGLIYKSFRRVISTDVISISELTPGLYFVKIIDPENDQFTIKKLIRN